AERAGPIAEVAADAESRERQEHWRLFYVAATRAEERLIVAGSLSARYRNGPPEASWYAAAAHAFDTLGVPTGEGRLFRGTTPADPVPARP
ncbi:hypothetical protein J8J20_22165, partial [Mycobacterium tuberculosis]|nr:hypothetical protein [Mycobacterium tuberculosis]